MVLYSMIKRVTKLTLICTKIKLNDHSVQGLLVKDLTIIYNILIYLLIGLNLKVIQYSGNVKHSFFKHSIEIKTSKVLQICIYFLTEICKMDITPKW